MSFFHSKLFAYLIQDFLPQWPLILSYKVYLFYIALKLACSCGYAEILRYFYQILCSLQCVGKIVFVSLPCKRCSDLQTIFYFTIIYVRDPSLKFQKRIKSIQNYKIEIKSANTSIKISNYFNNKSNKICHIQIHLLWRSEHLLRWRNIQIIFLT